MKKTLNVTIISTNSTKVPFAVMPLGACMVAEAAEAAGHHVHLLDLMFEKDQLKAVEKQLNSFDHDVVGVSVRNIDNNDMKNPVDYSKALVPLINLIRKKTKAEIVLGGAALSIMPEQLMRHLQVSTAVVGNGETSFNEVLMRISGGRHFDDIPGIATIKDGAFRISYRTNSDFSPECRVPYFENWIDVNAYVSRMSCVPVQTKRGCPYECIYCTYGTCEGNSYKMCTPDSVVKAVSRLARQGLRDIEFVDNVFNSPESHAKDICRGIIAAGVKARFHTLELNPRFIDDELLSLMKLAGFEGIGITAESASGIMLENLRKGFTPAHVTAAAQKIRKHGIPAMWIFMIGGPGETRETVSETLDFMDEYVRKPDVAFINTGIRIYPGTEIERIARAEGSLSIPSSEMLEPVSYISPALDKEWLVERLKGFTNAHMNVMGSDSVHSDLLPSVYQLAHFLGAKPPLWKYAPMIRRGLKFVGVNI